MVFFLVLVVQLCMTVQHLVSRKLKLPPTAPAISQSFNWPSWWIGVFVASLFGALLAGITPLGAGHRVCVFFHRLRGRLHGTLCDEGAQARPRHSQLGRTGALSHRCRRPAGPGGRPVLCGTGVFPLRPVVL